MKLTINGQTVEAVAGSTILQAARANGIYIPTLCYLKDTNRGACRLCLVEVGNTPDPKAACATLAVDGMTVETDTPRLRRLRRENLERLCAGHRMECSECCRGMDCELREMCKELGVAPTVFSGAADRSVIGSSSAHPVTDSSKCIRCRRCESTCRKIQGDPSITVEADGLRLNQVTCIGCGQCVAVCPTGALSVQDGTKEIWKMLLARKKVKTVALVSPYVCAQIGEFFGDDIGTENYGKTAALLRRLGFDEVCLTGKQVAACPTSAGGCTPWDTMARVLREARPEELFRIVAITPCTAAKAAKDGAVDAAVTTRELGEMWKRACVSNFTAVSTWKKLPEEPFDQYFREEAGDSCTPACLGGCAMGGGALAIRSDVRCVRDVAALREQAAR